MTLILSLRRLGFAFSLGVAPALGGCTVTNGTPSDDTAQADCHTAALGCGTGTTGYSCVGSATPADADASLSCGNGIDAANGTTSYCCAVEGAADTCSPSGIASCGSESDGYSCTGAARPTDSDPSLVCGAGAQASNGTTSYCCATASAGDECSPVTLASCGSESDGYSCTGAATPIDLDPALVCGDAADGGGGTSLYCCSEFSASTCTRDSSVVGCGGSSYGFSCSSTASPSDGDPTLLCSDPSAGQGGTSLYCCTDFSSSACALDDSVAGCSSDTYGFSCSGSDSPEQLDSSLACSTPVNGTGGALLYCCIDLNSSTCSADDSVEGCAGSSFGFSCTGSDSPEQADSSLVCSTPTAGKDGASLYCCEH